MKKCGKCGARNDDKAPACSQCGGRFDKGTTTRVSPVREQEPAGAVGLIPRPGVWRSAIGSSMKGRKPSPSAKLSDRHFLVPPLGDPLRLEPGADPIVLGREDDCTIHLASPTVSRRHAELSFSGTPPRPSLRDLGTKNGTYVNGVRLEGAHVLADRDLVRLGDVTAIYRVLEPGADEKTLLETAVPAAGLATETQTKLTAARKGSNLFEFDGDIALFKLRDLIAKFLELKAHGTLHVEVDGVPGWARLRDGSVEEASFLGDEGEAAVRSIGELRRGRFRFEPARSS